MFGDDTLFEKLVRDGDALEANENKNVDERVISFPDMEVAEEGPLTRDTFTAYFEDGEYTVSHPEADEHFEGDSIEDVARQLKAFLASDQAIINVGDFEIRESEEQTVPTDDLEEIPIGWDIAGNQIKVGDEVATSDANPIQGIVSTVWSDGCVDIDYTSGPGGPMSDTFDIKGHGVQKIVDESKLNEDQLANTVANVLRDRDYKVDYEELQGYIKDLNTDDYNDLKVAVEQGDEEEIANIMRQVDFVGSETNGAVDEKARTKEGIEQEIKDIEKKMGNLDAADPGFDDKVDGYDRKLEKLWKELKDVEDALPDRENKDENKDGENIIMDTVSNDPGFERLIESFRREGATPDTDEQKKKNVIISVPQEYVDAVGDFVESLGFEVSAAGMGTTEFEGTGDVDEIDRKIAAEFGEIGKKVSVRYPPDTDESEQVGRAVFTSSISAEKQAEMYPDLDMAPPRDSNWFEFAEEHDFRMRELDAFAKKMGFDNWYDLDMSISPDSLEERDPEKFHKVGSEVADLATPADTDNVEETKEVDESYGSVYIEADLNRGMPREEVVKKLQTRYPDIGDEEAEKIVSAVEKGEDWPRRESVEV